MDKKIGYYKSNDDFIEDMVSLSERSRKADNLSCMVNDIIIICEPAQADNLLLNQPEGLALQLIEKSPNSELAYTNLFHAIQFYNRYTDHIEYNQLLEIATNNINRNQRYPVMATVIGNEDAYFELHVIASLTPI